MNKEVIVNKIKKMSTTQKVIAGIAGAVIVTSGVALYGASGCGRLGCDPDERRVGFECQKPCP